MIVELTISFVVVFGIYLLYKRRMKKVKNYNYKVGFVKDNLGNECYKIVVKYSKNVEYIEAENIPTIKAGFISEEAFNIINDSWKDKKSAEKALEKFKIHLKIKSYEQTIKVQ